MSSLGVFFTSSWPSSSCSTGVFSPGDAQLGSSPVPNRPTRPGHIISVGTDRDNLTGAAGMCLARDRCRSTVREVVLTDPDPIYRNEKTPGTDPPKASAFLELYQPFRVEPPGAPLASVRCCIRSLEGLKLQTTAPCKTPRGAACASASPPGTLLAGFCTRSLPV